MTVCNACGMSGMEPDGCGMSRCPARSADEITQLRAALAPRATPEAERPETEGRDND